MSNDNIALTKVLALQPSSITCRYCGPVCKCEIFSQAVYFFQYTANEGPLLRIKGGLKQLDKSTITVTRFSNVITASNVYLLCCVNLTKE